MQVKPYCGQLSFFRELIHDKKCLPASGLYSWSNPAHASIHNGLQVSYINDEWFKEANMDDIYFYHSYANMTYNGFGLTIPMMNKIIDDNITFGTTMSYGEMESSNEENDYSETYESYETSPKITIAFNPFECYKEKFKDSFFKAVDLNVGLAYGYVYSDLAPEGNGVTGNPAGVKGKTHALDIGFMGVVHLSELNNLEFINLDASYGYTLTNMTDSKISYGEQFGSDSLPMTQRYGLGFYSAIPMRDIELFPSFNSFFKTIISFMYTFGKERDLNSNSNPINGNGFELGLLNTFFYREGSYEDAKGGIVGDSKGYGIRLNYEDIASLEYNYAEFPGGELAATQKSNDWMLNLNILKIYEMRNRN